MKVARLLLALATATLGALPAFAQSAWHPDGMGGYYGTGQNAGSALHSDGMGGFYGSGNLAGRTIHSDGIGGTYGGGRNSGSGWHSDGLARQEATSPPVFLDELGANLPDFRDNNLLIKPSSSGKSNLDRRRSES